VCQRRGGSQVVVDAKKRFWCLNCLAMYEFEQALMLHGSFARNRQPSGHRRASGCLPVARHAACASAARAAVRRAPCGSISHEPTQSLMAHGSAALPRCLQVHTLGIPPALACACPSEPRPCVHRRTLIPTGAPRLRHVLYLCPPSVGLGYLLRIEARPTPLRSCVLPPLRPRAPSQPALFCAAARHFRSRSPRVRAVVDAGCIERAPVGETDRRLNLPSFHDVRAAVKNYSHVHHTPHMIDQIRINVKSLSI